MIPRSLVGSAGHFWNPEEFENLENLDFEDLKHLQNLGHFLMTAGCSYKITFNISFFNSYNKKLLCNFAEINLAFFLINPLL